eukprot:CAMPEP_0169127938 /NCGR_PEP_ID=MMETSP1015-20121227/36287_1 /TAXON_ID=342587 /ORGANISM="Karlodinium micrum, Strain CCMP2283" /LENGTH=221 /DNA_ID=CAMNT_0009191779 /DNA_START=44 /DNA_END=709 /DNA_ORIENTATION=-
MEEIKYSSLLKRRRNTDGSIALGIDRDIHLPEVSTADTTSQHLEEMSPLAGGFSRAFRKKSIKLQEWTIHGHRKVIDIPIEQVSRQRPTFYKASLPTLGRPGFQRLVYQKARYLRDEKGHGDGYAGFQQVGRDMVRSVRVCMKIAFNLEKRLLSVRESTHNERIIDLEVMLDKVQNKTFERRRSIENLTLEELLQEDDEDDGWKVVLADKKLHSLILSFLD